MDPMTDDGENLHISTSPLVRDHPAEDRKLAVEMAWKGYYPVGYGLFGGLVLVTVVATVIVFFTAEGESARIPGTIGTFFFGSLISAGVFYSVFTRNRELAVLFGKGVQFVRAFFEEVRDRSLERSFREFEKFVEGSNLAWAERLVDPLPSKTARDSNVRFCVFVPPGVQHPQNVRLFGYFATMNRITVVPGIAANLTESTRSLFQKMTEYVWSAVKKTNAPFPVLCLMDTVAQCAVEGRMAQPIVAFFDQLSGVDLYFSEMVTTEYVGTSGALGEIKFTTRDDRSFYILGNPEVAKRLRDSIRQSKDAPPPPAAPRPEVPAPQAPPSPVEEEKECPMCAEMVKKKAKICRYCRYEFEA